MQYVEGILVGGVGDDLRRRFMVLRGWGSAWPRPHEALSLYNLLRAALEEIDESLRAQTTKSTLFCEMRVMS